MTSPSRPIRLYRNKLSGHAHRAELFLSLLGLPYEPVDVDMRQGEHKTPEFLAKNAFGQVPVIEDAEVTVADSNAILVYLALRYDDSGRWYPRDPEAAAQIQRWLSVAAGQLSYGPAAARRITLFGQDLDLEAPRAAAAQLFAVMDSHLSRQRFLAGPEASIADIALYSYTVCAPEGGVSLEPYPAVREWLVRVESLDGFVPMLRTAASP